MLLVKESPVLINYGTGLSGFYIVDPQGYPGIGPFDTRDEALRYGRFARHFTTNALKAMIKEAEINEAKRNLQSIRDFLSSLSDHTKYGSRARYALTQLDLASNSIENGNINEFKIIDKISEDLEDDILADLARAPAAS